VQADNGCVDHLDGRVIGGGECIHDPALDTGPTPTNGSGFNPKLEVRILRHEAAVDEWAAIKLMPT